MSVSYFDLNVYNYSIVELISLIKLPENYNCTTIESSISTIKEKIIDLKLSNNESKEYISFLNNTKKKKKNDLNNNEKNKLKNNIIELKNTQEILKRELNIMRKINEKIKKE